MLLVGREVMVSRLFFALRPHAPRFPRFYGVEGGLLQANRDFDAFL